MSDETHDGPVASVPDGDYPPPNFPVLFADGISALANSTTIVKFYLARNQPSMSATNPMQTQAFAQVVMPVESFVQSVLFMQKAMERMIEQKIFTQEDVERIALTVGVRE